jgi:DNA repair exonuclease SbcCD ATPase subunit
MITFESIEWKNFLSTGNSANKVLLNKSTTTLIIGKNGEGKSTILDALCFALFGKPFRNINKGQLINSINGKNCLVEIHFNVNNKSYKVIRGIKPNKFEIWCDDELLNQDAAAKDYQKVLEQQILKLNYKTFTQVVILGSASFVPFMQLSSAQRREVIEDILDIRIFSTMNQLLKEKASDTKSEIARIEVEIANAKTKVEAQNAIIKTISDARADNIRSIQEKIASSTQEVERNQLEVDDLIGQIGNLKNQIEDKKKVQEDIEKAKSIRSKLHNKIETAEHHKEFFTSHDVCPSCAQGIPHEHKESILSDLNAKVDDQNSKVAELESVLGSLNERLSNINEVLDLRYHPY